jgi:hypothetical protein
MELLGRLVRSAPLEIYYLIQRTGATERIETPGKKRFLEILMATEIIERKTDVRRAVGRWSDGILGNYVKRGHCCQVKRTQNLVLTVYHLG